METEQNRYSRGKIYSIRSHQTNDIYIGSTIDTLPKRLYQHKQDYKRFINGKRNHRTTSYEIIPYEDCYIELIENFPCNSKSELERKEGEHIRATRCVNKIVAGRTQKEYREENKEKITSINKEWYQVNKEQIILKKKEYRKDNKTLIALKKKEYYDIHKEQTKQYKKQYYENNKTQILLKRKEYRLKKKASLNLIN